MEHVVVRRKSIEKKGDGFDYLRKEIVDANNSIVDLWESFPENFREKAEKMLWLTYQLMGAESRLVEAIKEDIRKKELNPPDKRLKESR